MFDLSVFSERLKQARTLAKLSQGELAKIINVSSATISSYETNKNAKVPSLDKAYMLAKTLSVSLDWLCGLEEENNSRKILQTIKDFLNLPHIDVETNYYANNDDYIKICIKEMGICYFIQEYKKITDTVNNIQDDKIKKRARTLLTEDFDKSFTDRIYIDNGYLQYKDTDGNFMEFVIDNQSNTIKAIESGE